MKLMKCISALSLSFALIGIAQAKTGEMLWPPFQHVEVKEASKIYVYYKFDAHKQTLVCREDGPERAINSVEWEYKGATRKVELPVVLKDDKRFEGHWADPSGNLTITNDFGSNSPSRSIYVTCEYRQMD